MDQEQSPIISRIRSVPELVRKEVLAALIALVVICVLAAFLDAPLQGPAILESAPVEGIKAPWIFVGVQQALRYFSPFTAGVLAPFAAMLVIACLPYLRVRGRRGSQVIQVLFFGVLLVSISLTLWGYLS